MGALNPSAPNHMKSKCILMVSFVWLTALISLAADGRQTVSLSSLPAPVQKTIRTQAGDGKIGDIERLEEEGEVYFDTTVNKAGTERSMSVGEDGTLLSVEVALSETPEAVRKAIQTQVGAGTLDNIDKVFEDGKERYDIDFTTKDKTERNFVVSTNGKLEQLQVSLVEVPAAVRKTIEAHAGQSKLGDIFKILDADGIFYDVEMTQDGKNREFSVADDGKLESREVFLSELSAPAAATVKEKIGDGKILRIDEVFTKRGGVFPFEIEGRKDGKPFNFSVGPKGRFLGMDE